ncbi:putative Major facilitator superfamily domain-containing protein [Seiridium unicorne]|uniref:Major facilitator superfamily domain-containing protein n=1 Tax=Seiridium unicorne TaxID=138068 RepID=A0ABR2UG65_9PEZI
MLGCIGLTGVAIYERYICQSPMIQRSVFPDWTGISGHIGALLHGITLWLLVYYICLFYQSVRGYTPFETGVALLPETLTVAPAAVGTGYLISKIGLYRWALIVGGSLSTLRFGLSYLLDKNTSTGVMIIINMIPGLGLAILLPALAVTTQVSISPKDEGHAVAMLYPLRAAGQCVGVAIGGAIFTNRLGDQSLLQRSNSQISGERLSAVLIASENSGETPDVVVQALTDALRAVWVTGAVVAIIVTIVVSSARCPSLQDHEDKINLPEQEVVAVSWKISDDQVGQR